MELYKMNELEQRMAEDMDWAFTAPEVRQHIGMFVAVYKKRVVGVGLDRLALAKEAAAKEACHWADIVVVVVPSFDPMEIPH